MLVKELMEKLRGMPQDAEVFHRINAEDYGSLGFDYVILSSVVNDDGDVVIE